MPPRKAGGKQTDRNANKKAAKQVTQEDDEGPAVDNKLLGFAKSLALGSVALEYGVKLQPLVMEAVNQLKDGAKKDEGEKTNEEKAKDEPDDAAKEDEAEEKEEPSSENAENGSKKDTAGEAQGMFASLSSRLAWHNCLGLAVPFSAEDSKKAWIAMKGLELDGGPRAKRRGNPMYDRVVANLNNCLPQYLHVLLVLMILRAFLFRSWFACLPWLVFYQFASLMIPLENIPQVPALPLDKVDLKFRVAITVVLNILVWFFFAVEILWRAWWLEKFLYASIIIGHAYVVHPADK